jgi:ABC-type glycerol-3-phosphate transport system substrate-binding protein
MKKIFKIAIPFLALGVVMLLSGCLKSSQQNYKINLEVWGSTDNSLAFEKLVEEYRKVNPYVGEIKYRKMSYDTYKKDLVDALASGNGPDIFLINNNWLPYFQNKIEPAPDYFLKEVDVRDSFVDVVGKELIVDGKIYSLPMSVDSLALFVNKDMFNAAGITAFPSTWEELAEDSKKLTQIDETGNIRQSGIAMGTASNINRATDILALLMMQNGTEMNNPTKTEATFNKAVFQDGVAVKTGENALKFYTQFADLSSPYYTWNIAKHQSIDSFSEESVAMMINYSWQSGSLLLKNSKLNFTVVPVPQLAGKSPVNLAYYMTFVVNKNKMLPKTSASNQASLVAAAQYSKLRIHESWQLIKYLTMKNGGQLSLVNGLTGASAVFPVTVDPADEYTKNTARPAARRDLIEKQKSLPLLGAFATGNLIAESWYQSDPESVSAILAEMIDAINRGSLSTYNALQTAAQRVTQIMEK